MDGRTLSASVHSSTHTGYIGYGTVPVEITIENGLDEDLPYSIEVKPEKDLEIHLDGSTIGNLLAGESVKATGQYALLKAARSIDRDTNADEKVPTQAEWCLKLGGRTISLYNGLIPSKAVTVTLGPRYPALSPLGKEEIGFGVRNNTTEEIKGRIVLIPPEGVRVSPQNIPLKLKPGEVLEESLSISIESDIGSLLSMDLTLDLEDNGSPVRVSSKKFNIPVLGMKGAVAYMSLDDLIILETEDIRAIMNPRPALGFLGIDYKPLNRYFGGWNILGVETGYPFPGEGGEWNRLTPKVELENHDDFADVRLTAKFEERTGLRQTRMFW